MVLFFTGTGNSRYVAEGIAHTLEDQLCSLNDLIKQNMKEPIHSQMPFVFVLPTYGWRIPQIVEEFIQKTDFVGSKEMYFIMTCGDGIGNARKYCRLLVEEKKLSFQGLSHIVMPENYLALFPIPDEQESKRIIDEALPQILSISETIRQGKPLSDTPSGIMGTIQSTIINPIFRRFIISAKGFRVKDSCIHCGQCVKVCPTNNVSLVHDLPQWKNNCTHCMACISICPVTAIEYKNRTKGKRRYYLPEQSFSK